MSSSHPIAINLRPPRAQSANKRGRKLQLVDTLAETNATIGVSILIVAELMFFGGLVTALLVLRAGATWWPPLGQPKLPVAVTGINTIVLLLSGALARGALSAIEQDQRHILVQRLALAAMLGAAFLIIQGYEWVRLIHHGLRVCSGTYGPLFIMIVSAHALHVLGGLFALVAVLWLAMRGHYSRHAHGSVEACVLFWTFVVLLWPVLYVLVYVI